MRTGEPIFSVPAALGGATIGVSVGAFGAVTGAGAAGVGIILSGAALRAASGTLIGIGIKAIAGAGGGGATMAGMPRQSKMPKAGNVTIEIANKRNLECLDRVFLINGMIEHTTKNLSCQEITA
jgi:hypothetical protein